MTIITTPEGIQAFRLLSLQGLRFRGGSAFSAVKREFGLKGRNASVLEQFETLLREQEILLEEKR